MDYIENRKQIAEKIIGAIEKGEAPWMKNYSEKFVPKIAVNGITGNNFKGINAINLMMQGYDDNRWYTFNQVKELGGKINKEELGTKVEYWKFNNIVNKKNENGEIIKETVNFENPRLFHAVVFNSKQCSGIPNQDLKKETDKIQKIEQILQNSTADIENKSIDAACYSEYQDKIILPEKNFFPDKEQYYQTAVKELVKWSGHSTRMDRDINSPFGTKENAQEALKTEIATLLLCSNLELDYNPEQNKTYQKAWVEILKEDPNFIFKAINEAEQINDYILSFENKKLEIDHDKWFQKELNQNKFTVKIYDNKINKDEIGLAYNRNKINVPLTGIDAYSVLTDIKEWTIESNQQNLNKSRTLDLKIGIKGYEKDITLNLNDKNIKEGMLISDYLSNTDIPQNLINDIRSIETKYLDKNIIQKINKESKQIIKKDIDIINDDNQLKEFNKLKLEKTYINVPYSEKEEAKKLGAKWDKDAESWYFTKEKNIKDFSKWLKPKTPIKKEASEINKIEFITKKQSANKERKEYEKKVENIPTERTYINVPYSEKEEASKLGAKWDKEAKSWYVPNNVDLSQFKQWNKPKVIEHEQILKENVKEKIFLDVPFKERESAKKLGAKWDKEAKSWYVEKGANLIEFQHWKKKEKIKKDLDLDMLTKKDSIKLKNEVKQSLDVKEKQILQTEKLEKKRVISKQKKPVIRR